MKTINLRKIQNGDSEDKWRHKFVEEFKSHNPNRVDLIQLVQSADADVLKMALIRAQPNLEKLFAKSLEQCLLFKGPAHLRVSDYKVLRWCKLQGVDSRFMLFLIRAAQRWYAYSSKYTYAIEWLPVLDPAYDPGLDPLKEDLVKEMESGSLTKMRADALSESATQIMNHVKAVLEKQMRQKRRVSLSKLNVRGLVGDQEIEETVLLDTPAHPSWMTKKTYLVKRLSEFIMLAILARRGLLFFELLSRDNQKLLFTFMLDVNITMAGHMVLSHRSDDAMCDINKSFIDDKRYVEAVQKFGIAMRIPTKRSAP